MIGTIPPRDEVVKFAESFSRDATMVLRSYKDWDDFYTLVSREFRLKAMRLKKEEARYFRPFMLLSASFHSLAYSVRSSPKVDSSG